jgi:hypothetical protein
VLWLIKHRDNTISVTLVAERRITGRLWIMNKKECEMKWAWYNWRYCVATFASRNWENQTKKKPSVLAVSSPYKSPKLWCLSQLGRPSVSTPLCVAPLHWTAEACTLLSWLASFPKSSLRLQNSYTSARKTVKVFKCRCDEIRFIQVL